jgi:hypothetical protein
MKQVLILAYLILWTSISWAGDGNTVEKPDFGRLKNSRAQIIAEIDSKKNDIRRNEDEARRISSGPVIEIEAYIQRTQKEVEEQKKRFNSEQRPDIKQNLGRDLSYKEEQVARARSDLEQRIKFDKDADVARGGLKNLEKQLFDVEAQINDLLARDVVAQNFKSQISLYFAIVVGLMILCFFGVAFYDEKVRVTIFSGQTGMQFVTLFSIIIAIILFGITGILGDKELSALLGGLSGYILGRYNQSGTSRAEDKTKNLDGTPISDPKTI